MTESVWGGTAAPHPTAKQTFSITGTVAGSEAGTFDVTVKVAGGASATATVAFNVTAAAMQTALRALSGIGSVSGVTVTGGVLGTAPYVVSFPVGPVAMAVSGDDFTEASTVTVEQTAEGLNRAGNRTVLNPTGADRVDGAGNRGSYSRDYTTASTPGETYVQPDGTNIPAGGGLTATAP
jgi:hypothetical protein